MKRLSGIAASAVIAIIGSIGALLFGALMVVSSVITHNTPLPPPPPGAPYSPVDPSLMLIIIAILYFAFGVWGFVSAVGLLRLRNWARVCFAIYGGILAFFSSFGAIGLLVAMWFVPRTLPPTDTPAMFVEIVFVAFIILALLCTALGTWWVIYFNRQRVKVQFLGEVAASATRQFPLSITIIAWVLVVGGIMLLPQLFSSYPRMIFGFILRGLPGRILYLVYGVVSLTAGIGLLKKRVEAHSLAVGYFSFGLLNALLTYAIPGSLVRAEGLIEELQRGRPMPIPMNTILGFSVVISLVAGGVGLWFLITRRQAFIEACGR